MGNRIMTVAADGILAVQRQARELGRIRTGWSEPYTKDGRELRRPVKSRTIVLTSQQRSGLDLAAEAWGGTVERWQPQGNHPEAWRLITEQEAIDAILPPGDPLNQTMEMWSGGGCVRRCNGMVEAKTNQPCLCRAEFGEDFHMQRGNPPKVCKPYSRLGVFLDLDDFGLWRIQTNSYYAMLEMAGVVDLLINHLDPAKRGLPVSVPIRLRIDPRTRLKDGKSTAFPVIAIELLGRGIVSQVLSGRADGFALAAPPERAAIEAGPAPVTAEAPAVPPGSAEIPPGGDGESAQQIAEFKRMILHQNTEQELRTLWTWISQNNQMTADQARALTQDFWARLNQMRGRPAPASAPAAAVTPAAEPAAEPKFGGPFGTDAEPNKGALWMQVLIIAGQRGWDTERTEQEMVKQVGYNLIDADGFAMEQFLRHLEQAGARS
jgi:hypothetical protein